jgi:N-methylhydantoinase B
MRDGRVDVEATAQRRLAIAQDRLARALSAPKPIPTMSTSEPPRTDPGDVPLYVGVIQRGALAISEQSGVVLAVAPDHWTDGCPILVETRSDLGPEVHIRSYLDPVSGRTLFVEAVPAGAPRSFESAPNRWLQAR